MNIERIIAEKFRFMSPTLNEQSRRRWVATEAKAIGRGGVSLVARATGISRNTIAKGIDELALSKTVNEKHIRKKGGGRKSCTTNDKSLEHDIELLVEPTSRGDPESPLKYTIKSTRVLERELNQLGHHVSYPTVASLLHHKGYSLQANKKTCEGSSHPDRNAQFEFINKDVKKCQKLKEPVISVDTKKKELVGNFKNNGQEWHKKGKPEEVRVHDFEIPELGKVVPYGIYDIDNNHGWINLGIDSDTAEFAVESIRRWWKNLGKKSYPRAKTLTITADSGGSNSSRARLWKYELQRFSDETGLQIRVRHFPPGTSKWNKIEHRLFSFISQNWRGKPLISHAVIINLISSTTTKTGLKVDCKLDTNKYQTGKKISDEEFSTIQLVPEKFHGDWNYTIRPKF
ncbi:ISAzo13 family transposase [Candidatus Gottesmanbacteria bacterium]|nr:ISAzo13 family transposase [Candidatus Gottesmanbacteria bacterium]